VQEQSRRLFEERVRPFGSQRNERHSEVEGRRGHRLQVMKTQLILFVLLPGTQMFRVVSIFNIIRVQFFPFVYMHTHVKGHLLYLAAAKL